MALFGGKNKKAEEEEGIIPAVAADEDKGKLILEKITALEEKITTMAQRQEEALGGLEEVLKELSAEEAEEVAEEVAEEIPSETAEDDLVPEEEAAPQEEIPEDIKAAEGAEEEAAEAAEETGEDDVAEMIRKEVPELEEMLGDEKFQEKLKNLSEEEQERIMQIMKEDPVKGARMIVDMLKGEGEAEEEDLSSFAAMPIEQNIDAKERDEIKNYFGASA